MDLPRAELRTTGLAAMAAAFAQRRERAGTWLRPRAAPLAITALATLCMFAGLDLIAHDFRKLRESRGPDRPPIYLMSVSQVEGRAPVDIIPVELAPVEVGELPVPVWICDDRGCTAVVVTAGVTADGDTVVW